MSLDDREQRILAEIERQFYEEDPDLAHAVRNIDRSARFGIRLPAIGLIAGAVIVVLSFTFSTLLALLGFVMMVVSATALAHAIRNRGGGPRSTERASLDIGGKLWRRFRRD
jgi:uncharacterized membrane protein YoaK (UPF0700 family)